MKIRVHFQGIDQTAEAPDADALLHLTKQEAAKRAPLLLRGLVKNLSDTAFAAEVVKRANQAQKRNDPPPASAQAFLDWGVERGFVTILEP